MLLAHESRCVALAASLGIGHATAAPVDGEVGSNLASLLVLLGVWALFMGMRNLRELRHKRLTPQRQQRSDGKSPPTRADTPIRF